MRLRQFSIVWVLFSIFGVGLLLCPVSEAESNQHTRPLVFSPPQIRQCHYPNGDEWRTLLARPSTLKTRETPPPQPGNNPSQFLEESSLREIFETLRHEFARLGHTLNATLTIRNSSVVNAYALYQREVVITHALLVKTPNTSERAFVMAHELAHIALGHGPKAGIPEELAADTLALRVVTRLGFDPCSGSSVLERLGSPSKITLVSVSPRLTALHNRTFDQCG